ncbi:MULTISPECIES: hypothetical protein [Mycobacteriaceae]|uniref:Uncharacterized protein n=1 Tax=Mycolicibacterium parafortuitum TaxID=39692 RepID=A0ACC6MDI6_MYCPF|nr:MULTISPECIES: hypothetical protein [Mycobacteriaceae]MDZ5084983.1 hypothetical protein [Mycolicibacterium parafortuitum]
MPGQRPPVGPTWQTYQESIGDRSGLFETVTATWAVERALYLGCYLDLSPSVAIPSVTYVDVDRRAARYFADNTTAAAELRSRGVGERTIEFLHADYDGDLGLADGEFDLLISLYAGPVWNHSRRYLRSRGLFLANTSHGDASLAALDPALELVAAVHHRNDTYRLDSDDLDSYLQPKKPETADPDLIRNSGRGIAYTRSAFTYLFRLRE